MLNKYLKKYLFFDKSNASRCLYNFYTTHENMNLLYNICLSFKFKQLWGNYGYPIGNLRDKKAIIFCTYGSPRLAITTFFLNLPIRRLKRGVFHMCGIYNINYRRYFAVPFVSNEKRQQFLNDVKKTAFNV